MDLSALGLKIKEERLAIESIDYNGAFAGSE